MDFFAASSSLVAAVGVVGVGVCTRSIATNKCITYTYHKQRIMGGKKKNHYIGSIGKVEKKNRKSKNYNN